MELMYTILRPDSKANRPQIGRLQVVRHQETPGISDFLRTPESGWLAGLQSRNHAELSRIDTVSGATITSSALLAHLREALKNPGTDLSERRRPCQ